MPDQSPGSYVVSTDPDRLDVNLIHAYLCEQSYWAAGIPLDVVARSIGHSLCFGVYDGHGSQVGFARVITDRATFGYLADVFVLPAHRGRGISKLLMSEIMAHNELQGLRNWFLYTRDAHGLYAQFGFEGLPDPARAMQRRLNDPYGAAPGTEERTST